MNSMKVFSHDNSVNHTSNYDHSKLISRHSHLCFSAEYASVFEKMDTGIPEEFVYTSKNGTVIHTFIKRQLPYEVEGKEYFDITTPYGFGGPLVIHTTDVEKLLKEYFDAFHHYCIENNIVSEFVRFHIFDNAVVCKYYSGETFEINSVIYKDLDKNISKEMEPRILKDVKKAEHAKISVEFDYVGDTQTDFLSLYTETMDRHHAVRYYYIDHSFLNNLRDRLKGQYVFANARLSGKIISTRLVLFDRSYGYYFLGGNDANYYDLKSGTYLDYMLLNELKGKGVAKYIFGGGHNGNDGLYKYKKKFSMNGEIPFFVGNTVHIKDVYDELIQIRMSKGPFDSGSSFFPKYRSPEAR
ncbi:hypothetical protein ADIAL_0773 [Alkalibacterium sp. AK22]|nr:hypothetical protein ADIAL_0773 [Alkalibacterium sp. AK22]